MDLHLTRPGPVVPVAADPLGLAGPTPGQARGSRWRTSSPGRFVPVGVRADDTQQRIVEAVAGGVAGTAATGWSALHWQGARWFSGRRADGTPEPVLLAVGDAGNLAPRPGVRFCYDWLFDDDVIDVDGLPVTRPERSVCAEVLRVRTLARAVRIIEMATADDLVDLDALEAYALRIKGRPHTVRLFSALGLADENVWSPGESDMRHVWRTHRDSALLCNPPLFDHQGHHLLTPDLLDPVAGVIGEYNGRVHDERVVRRRDLNREELCRDLGLEVVEMVSMDLRDIRSFERRLDAAYERALGRREAGVRRQWTLEQPSWWIDTSTVVRRRALSDRERELWLRRLSA